MGKELRLYLHLGDLLDIESVSQPLVFFFELLTVS